MADPVHHGSARPVPPRRADASAALLTEVMDRPLDPGYAAAAARRGTAPRRRAGRGTTLLVLVLVGLLLTTAALRTRAADGRGPAAARAQLLERVQEQTARSDELAVRAAGLRTGNAELTTRLGGADAVADDARADALAVGVGAVAVTGPGVQVVLDDAPAADEDALATGRTGAGGSAGRVVDRDVQLVVNGLWQAGAEAVAVNGQRLTTLSSIRSAGDAVLVDYRPLTPPYTVTALGDPTRLQTGLATSVAGRYLKVLADDYGIAVDVRDADRLALPAATRLDLRTAVPAGG